MLEIAAASVFISYQSQVRQQLEAGLNKTIDEINKNNDTAALNVMNTVQTLFHCCGCHGPTDYKLPIPDSCNDSEHKLYMTGCYESIISYINTHLPVVLGLAITMIIFQFFCLIISIRTCLTIRYEGYEDI